MDFREKLASIVGVDNIYTDEPMSAHTTFGVGGPADYLVVPRDEESLREGIKLCSREGIPFFITGRGSNLLVGDGGYRGVIFNICKTMEELSFLEREDELKMKAGAGNMLTMLARKVCQMGYGGFEFATGIPGTLGGAVAMNAGAYGGEISDVIVSARLMDREGRVRSYSKEELCLGYRRSIVTEKELIVLEADFLFKKGDSGLIMEKVAELASSRKEKQPLEYPSAGSTFKRPEGYFAGKIIEDAGLKGYSKGGAQVSEKHCGFVINTGNASAKDISELIKDVQERVYERSGVMLEPEVKMIGTFL